MVATPLFCRSLFKLLALDATGEDRFDTGYSSAEGGGALVKDSTGTVVWAAP